MLKLLHGNMTTPREQIAAGIAAALSGVAYSTADAINHAVAFENLLVKVEQHLLAAGWTPPANLKALYANTGLGTLHTEESLTK